MLEKRGDVGFEEKMALRTERRVCESFAVELPSNRNNAGSQNTNAFILVARDAIYFI